MIKKIVLVNLIISLLLGCTTPRFYDEVLSTNTKNSADINSSTSSLKPHRIVFNTLESELKKSDHIIYLYSPFSEWDSKEFSGVVYDVSSNKYYYFESNKKNIRKLKISTSYKQPDDNYYKFVIENFREGKLNYLKKLGEISGHSGVRTTEVIYDINLKNGLLNRHTFEDFLFMNGKPTKDIEESN